MFLEFKDERDADFMTTYNSVISQLGDQARYLKKEDLLYATILHPAKRFYVSEEQAIRVVTKLMRGGSINFRNTLKAEMYANIVAKVQESDKGEIPLKELIIKVVYSPAPRFYITLESAAILYYKLFKKQR